MFTFIRKNRLKNICGCCRSKFSTNALNRSNYRFYSTLAHLLQKLPSDIDAIFCYQKYFVRLAYAATRPQNRIQKTTSGMISECKVYWLLREMWMILGKPPPPRAQGLHFCRDFFFELQKKFFFSQWPGPSPFPLSGPLPLLVG